jgi:hypothetical protein
MGGETPKGKLITLPHYNKLEYSSLSVSTFHICGQGGAYMSGAPYGTPL